MTTIGGFVFLLVMVFGGYLIAGGKFGIIIAALPFEMMMIGGAAVGSFVMANSMHDVKHTLGGVGKILKGARFHKQDYMDILSLLYFFVRLAQTKGAMALEAHIEKPEESPAFAKFPKIKADHHAVSLICDYLRMVGMNADDPHQIEDVMARELKKIKEEELHASHALQSVADALPALGIVAAVLGVIKTMGSIDQPPAVLGKMIGGALVGTFLGILLAYAFAEPLAGLLEQKNEESGKELQCIKTTLLASMQGYAPQVAIEFGRKVLLSTARPTFSELEAHVKQK